MRPSLKDPQGYTQANVLGTVNVLEFCKARNVQNLVFGSSSSVYGTDSPVPFTESNPMAPPISPYAATKRAGEFFCQTYAHLYGLRVACLRLFTVYGPRQRPDLAIHKFARAMHAGESITLYGDGSTSRDYTYVSDIVSGILAAEGWLKEQPAGTCDSFNLGGTHATSLREMVALLEKYMEVEAKILIGDKQPGDVERTLANVEKANRAFGYSPKVTMDQGVSRFIEWFRRENPSSKKAA